MPTEAEWEYACRAGTQTPFNTGNCLDAETEANYDGNQPYTDCSLGPFEGGSVIVGSYPANSFNLFDMHGNLCEWCNDWYGDYNGNETDPVGPSVATLRVVRGGYWYNGAKECRSAKRFCYDPETGYPNFSFRPVRSVK